MQMVDMLLKGLAVNEYIIKEDNSTPAEARFQSTVHGALESAGRTRKPKGDDLEFVMAHMSGERSLMLFTFT